jgi:hypothetical protein
MSQTIDQSTEPNPVPADPGADHAGAVSQRNGLVAVSLVLGSTVIIAGRSLLAGIADVVLWTLVATLAFAFALLVGACLRAAKAVHERRGPDPTAYKVAVGGLFALGVAVTAAWLTPPARSISLPDGHVWVTYYSGDLRGANCATVTQWGTMLRLETTAGRIILVPQDAIVEMSRTEATCIR